MAEQHERGDDRRVRIQLLPRLSERVHRREVGDDLPQSQRHQSWEGSRRRRCGAARLFPPRPRASASDGILRCITPSPLSIGRAAPRDAMLSLTSVEAASCSYHQSPSRALVASAALMAAIVVSATALACGSDNNDHTYRPRRRSAPR